MNITTRWLTKMDIIKYTFYIEIVMAIYSVVYYTNARLVHTELLLNILLIWLQLIRSKKENDVRFKPLRHYSFGTVAVTTIDCTTKIESGNDRFRIIVATSKVLTLYGTLVSDTTLNPLNAKYFGYFLAIRRAYSVRNIIIIVAYTQGHKILLFMTYLD